MPKRRYEQREPTHDWKQIRPLLKDQTQISYEVIRPVLLFGVTPKERATQTGVSPSTIYYHANLFDQAGMAALFAAAPPPAIPKTDKRELPPDVRQEIVDLHAEYPALRPNEIATICFVKFNRRPSARTIKLVLASGPSPSSTKRRHPRYAEIEEPRARRRLIIDLHTQGWNAASIAGYLEVSRNTVHKVLRRFAQEHFAGLDDKSHARKRLRKVDISTMQQIKKLSENPELGAYRVSAALEQMGIKLSPSTCGRYLAINRRLYHLQMPRNKGGRPKKAMPYAASHRHQYWTTDIRYIDMHHLPGEDKVYSISILENFSRAILASAITRRQDTESYLAVLYAAVRRFGVPKTLISDSGTVFRSHDVMRIYDRLGIRKEQIPRGKPYTSYIETAFNVQRRLADWHFERAQTWEDLLAAHDKWLRDYNYQKHQAHDDRDDGAHSPAAVLGWVKGMQPNPQLVYRVFSAVGAMRTINKAGYVRYRDFWLYGERNLSGEKTLVNVFQDILTLEYQEKPISRYSVEWNADNRHFHRVGNPRLYDHGYESAQQELWGPGEVDWFVVMRAEAYGKRPRRKRVTKVLAIQPPIFPE